MLIEAGRSGLLVVDVQERLAPAVAGGDEVIACCGVLIEAAGRLDVPVLASEQYPKGLGPTVAALRDRLEPAAVLAKTAFACTGEAEIERRVRELDREIIVVCGMEAHICVLQSVLGIRRMGLAAVVVADATGSRNPWHRDLAFDRLRANGVEIATTEMVLFEWLARAGTPEFKALSPLIR